MPFGGGFITSPTNLWQGDGFQAAAASGPQEWAFQPARTATGSGGASATVTCTPKPNVGDLICLGWTGWQATPFTGVTLSDNGSGGWTQIGTFVANAGTFSSAAAWWKVATAADFNGGGGFTITLTGTGGSGTLFLGQCEADVFTPPSGKTPGVDCTGQATAATATTVTYHPSAGSTHPAFTDELVWVWTNGGASGSGPPVGVNTYTATSAAANLTQATTANQADDWAMYAFPVQSSATTATNTIVQHWTSSGTGAANSFMATFFYS